jgi:hypothetical protein
VLGLGRNEGQASVTGKRRQRGNLLGSQQDQHLVGAQVERNDMVGRVGTQESKVHHSDTETTENQT